MIHLVRPTLTLAACLMLAPWLVQCDRPNASGQAETKKSKSGRPVADPAEAVPVEVKEDGLAYRPGSNTLFTGEAVELNPEVTPAVVLWRTPYVDGKKHGVVTRWSPKGKVLEERRYVHGQPQSAIGYHSNGEKKLQVTLNANDKAEGPYSRWHDNAVLHVESAFDAEERAHGEEKIFDREGNLLAHYRNEHGKMVEIIFETPEEKERRIAHWAELEAAQKEAAQDASEAPAEDAR